MCVNFSSQHDDLHGKTYLIPHHRWDFIHLFHFFLVHVFTERENNKNFHTWTYPTITDDHKNYILQKCFCRNDTLRYTCRRNSNTWFYICEVSEKSFAVVILAKEFEPNKYKVLCDILAKKYSETRNPVDLVALYLNLYTSGGLHDNGTLFAGFKKFECATNIKGWGIWVSKVALIFKL